MTELGPDDGIHKNNMEGKDIGDIFTWCSVESSDYIYIIERQHYEPGCDPEKIYHDEGGMKIEHKKLSSDTVWGHINAKHIYPPAPDETWKRYEDDDVENSPKLTNDLTGGKWRNIDYRAVRDQFPWLGEKVYTKRELYFAVVYMKYASFNPLQRRMIDNLKPVERKRLSFEIRKCSFFRQMPKADWQDTYWAMTGMTVQQVHELIALRTSAEFKELPFTGCTVKQLQNEFEDVSNKIKAKREAMTDSVLSPEQLDDLLLDYLAEDGMRNSDISISDFTGKVTANFSNWDFANANLPDILRAAPMLSSPTPTTVFAIDQVVLERLTSWSASCEAFSYRSLCGFSIGAIDTMRSVLECLLHHHFPGLSDDSMKEVLAASRQRSNGLYCYLRGFINLEKCSGVVKELENSSKGSDSTLALTCCPGFCGECFSPEHTRRMCPKTKCKRCRKKGHWQQDCTTELTVV